MKPALLQENPHLTNHSTSTNDLPPSILPTPLGTATLPSQTNYFSIFKLMKSLNCLLLLSYSLALLISPSEAQNPCSLQSECSGGCCQLLEVNDILGYYCQSQGECNKSNLGITSLTKAEGGSCSRTSDCSSNCCQGGVCRQQDYCYSSYLEPFIIILVIVLLIIIGVVLFFVIRSCIRKRKLKKKQLEKQQQKGQREQEQSLVRNNDGYQSPRHPLQNGINGADTRGPRQI